MYLFRGGDFHSGKQNPEEMQTHMEKFGKWMGELAQKGALVGGDPLHKEGMQVIGTKKTVTDGPFIEAKELVGGYVIVNAKDIQDAVEISKGCPILDVDGKIEVRRVMNVNM